MNSLPDDVIIYTALVMDIPQVLKLCSTSSRFNRIICNNQKYWMNKLLIDFPENFNRGNISKYGPDYKNYYKSHAYKTILINVTIDQYNEEAWKYEHIDTSYNLIYHKNTDITKLVFDIIGNMFSQLNISGSYIVINDEEECEDIYPFSKECFENIDNNTQSITINFRSDSFVDETDGSLSVLLKESIKLKKSRK